MEADVYYSESSLTQERTYSALRVPLVQGKKSQKAGVEKGLQDAVHIHANTDMFSNDTGVSKFNSTVYLVISNATNQTMTRIMTQC